MSDEPGTGDGIRTRPASVPSAHVADPRIVELRAWSRLTEELQEERVRLGNRVQQQLWRYYPQMQKITNDLAAPWFLELRAMAPTPGKARQYASRQSSRYSRSIASVASMPTPRFACCENRPSKLRRALRKRSASICARSSLACTWSIVSCGRPSRSSISSALGIGQTEGAPGRNGLQAYKTSRSSNQFPVSAGSSSATLRLLKPLSLSAAVTIQRCEPCACRTSDQTQR